MMEQRYRWCRQCRNARARLTAHTTRGMFLSHVVSDLMRTTKQEWHVSDYPAFWTLRVLCPYLLSGYPGLAKGCLRKGSPHRCRRGALPVQSRTEDIVAMVGAFEDRRQQTSGLGSAFLEDEGSRCLMKGCERRNVADLYVFILYAKHAISSCRISFDDQEVSSIGAQDHFIRHLEACFRTQDHG